MICLRKSVGSGAGIGFYSFTIRYFFVAKTQKKQSKTPTALLCF